MPRRAASCTQFREIVRNLRTPRPSFADVPLNRPRIMGIINVTPDSFSDGGLRFDSGRAIADGLEMLDDGADFLDVGGVSTRPYARPIGEDEELRRVLPVVRGLLAAGSVVSVDTQSMRVMSAAMDAGAQVINSVGALEEEGCMEVVAQSAVSVVLCHRRGRSEDGYAHLPYRHPAFEVFCDLWSRVTCCIAVGVARERIAVDPGIGFGKDTQENLQLLSWMSLFHGLGCALLVGVSRKRFVGAATGEKNVRKRFPGSMVAALEAVQQGTQIVRVHDVARTRQALDMALALRSHGLCRPETRS